MRVWLLLVAALVFAMIVVGGAVRLTDSGLALIKTSFLLRGSPVSAGDYVWDGTRLLSVVTDYQVMANFSTYVYAVGVVLFRMLTRKLPNERGSTENARPAALPDTTKPEGRGLEFVTDMKLASLVGDCLSDDPAQRPTAAALATALARFADDMKATLAGVDVGGAAPELDVEQQETTWQRRT